MRNCGCKKSIDEPYEYTIEPTIKQDLIVEDFYQEPENLCKLKYKVIQEFSDIINKLECGQKPDLEFLLEEISLIYIYNNE